MVAKDVVGFWDFVLAPWDVLYTAHHSRKHPRNDAVRVLV